jgi:hypothetical protein
MGTIVTSFAIKEGRKKQEIVAVRLDSRRSTRAKKGRNTRICFCPHPPHLAFHKTNLPSLSLPHLLLRDKPAITSANQNPKPKRRYMKDRKEMEGTATPDRSPILSVHKHHPIAI